MSGLIILGIDPGLKTTGLCIYDASTREVRETVTVKVEASSNDAELIEMRSRIVTGIFELIDRHGDPNVTTLEDFRFRSPRVSQGLVKHAVGMGKLVGWLEYALTTMPCGEIVLVNPSESKRDQPADSVARKMGLPGRNGHERSAYYAALWVAGTIRLAGGAR